MLQKNLALLLGAIVCASVRAEFGSFDLWKSHPLAKYLKESGQKPVVLSEYYFKTKNGDAPEGDKFMSENTQFMHRSATYRFGGEITPTFSKVDAMLIRAGNGRRNISDYLTLKLSQPTKVVVILNSVSMKELSEPIQVVYPAGFKSEGKVYAEGFQGVKSPVSSHRLLRDGFAVSKLADQVGPEEWQVLLPSAQNFVVNGLDKPPTVYSILFVDPDTNAALPYPSTPEFLSSTPIVPRTKCPDGLHNLWTATSRDTSDPDNYVDRDVSNDLVKHTTWHPLIDPVYYCSYGHDHGSYPGPVYKPAFTHTAWKTEDANNDKMDFRQDESDSGFKVFTMFEEGHHWIFTVHMQLSTPRRFHTRHHTMHVAVFDSDWKALAELNMKNDFGFAATKAKGVETPLTDKEDVIRKELRNMRPRRRFFRRFNVAANDGKCPFSGRPTTTPFVNRKGKRVGKAEHWVSSLETCTTSRFRIDVSAPETGLATCNNDKDTLVVDKLTGTSMNRKFTALGQGIHLCKDLCRFKADIPSGPAGEMVKFYTDSYFTEVKDGPGKFHLAQWMEPSFSATLPKGTYVPSSPWHGHFVLRNSDASEGRFRNIEGWAVFPGEN